MRRVVEKSRTAAARAGSAAGIVLPPDATTAEAFQTIAMTLQRAIAARRLGVRRGDPTGIHQMRIALRRMRAAISVFGDLIDGPGARHLKHELKWLAGRMAPARDLHLLDQKFRTAEIGASPALLQRLASDRSAAFADAKAAVDEPRFRDLLHQLRRWIETGNWAAASASLEAERPARQFAKQALARRARKLAKKLKRLEELDDEQRHRVRIAAKKLNYAIWFFDSLFVDHDADKRLQRFRKHLKKLLDALGILNDVAVHRRITGQLEDGAKGEPDRDAVRALSDLDDAEIRKQMKAAVKAAAKLADDPLFGD